MSFTGVITVPNFVSSTKKGKRGGVKDRISGRRVNSKEFSQRVSGWDYEVRRDTRAHGFPLPISTNGAFVPFFGSSFF